MYSSVTGATLSIGEPFRTVPVQQLHLSGRLDQVLHRGRVPGAAEVRVVARLLELHHDVLEAPRGAPVLVALMWMGGWVSVAGVKVGFIMLLGGAQDKQPLAQLDLT